MVPRLGVYVGRALDVTCRGDNTTYEALLHEASKCTLECIPELSYFKGGQPPWHVEGTWELDGEDLVISVTKQDITGPRKDTDIRLPMGADGSLSFRGTRCAWRGPPPEDDKLKAKAEELAKAAAETQAKQAELEAGREELRAQREQQDAQSREEQEQLERLRKEVQQQREQQETEARLAEEERARLEAEKEEQEAIFAKQKAELDALAKVKEEIQRSREEARRRQEEQQKELQEQQALLEAERSKVESDRAAREAERAARQAELEAQKEELQKQKQLVEWQRSEEEALRQAQVAELSLRQEELHDRAQNLVQTEQVLTHERERIMKSRSSLAMVQAHVVSMLGKEAGKQEINLDAADEPEAEDAPDKLDESEGQPVQGDDVWSMDDWSSVHARHGEAALD
mmetsp:Transcript_121194/g.354241  ORF Transcript_121194/g.354241 Transcript_121194/m.354241 type:complete len:401 (+) Transcript_121194:82-1284(+)